MWGWVCALLLTALKIAEYDAPGFFLAHLVQQPDLVVRCVEIPGRIDIGRQEREKDKKKETLLTTFLLSLEDYVEALEAVEKRTVMK